MNNIFLLTKVFLKNSMFKKINTNLEDNNSKKVIKTIGYIIIFAYIVGVFGVLSYQMIDMLNSVNQAALFLGMLLLSIAILVLIQSAFSAMNLFYFSKDIENVLPLPVKSYQILIAKFNVLMITEYVVICIFALVPLIIYGILTGAGKLFYLYGLITLFTFPIFPAIIATFFIVVFMSFTKFVKNKEKLQLIGTIVTIALVFGVQFSFFGQNDIETEQLVQMLTKTNGLVEILDDYFITLKPALNTLINYNTTSGAESVLICIGITIGFFILFVLFAQKLYLRGVIGAVSSGKGRRKNNYKLNYNQKNIVHTYVEKEMIILFKNPIYFMQCVLPPIIMPILFAIVFFLNHDGLSTFNIFSINNSIGLCVVLGVIAFLMSMVFIPITAFSKDGTDAIFTKYIPVSYYKQFIYKMIPSIIISIFIIAITFIIISFIFKMSVNFIVGGVLNSLLIIVLYSYLMQIVDLKRPKLNWDTEYAVVKQNFNMIFCFAFSLVYVVIFILGGYYFRNKDLTLVSSIFIVMNTLILFGIDRYVYHNQVKLFKKIQ